MEHEQNYDDAAWMRQADCVGRTELFFPPSYYERKEHQRQREKLATSICKECVVKTDCLKYALNNNEVRGIWGGMTEEQRSSLSPQMSFRAS